MLGVSAAFDDHLDQQRGFWTDLFGPFNDPGRSPLQIFLVRGGHVLFERSVAVRDKACGMTGHPLAFLEDFHGVGAKPDIEFFSHEAERDAVVMVLDLDVVVDIDGGQFPLGILVRLFGK